MKQRIFLAINLPEDIKKSLAEYRDKYAELPCRWTKTENLHITLVFIGEVEEGRLLEIRKVVSEVVQNYKAFNVDLKRISYSPEKILPPRMIWAIGESEEFNSLKKELEKKLSVPEDKKSYLHITLARIRGWEWRKIEPEERPEVGENIGLSFKAESIELMESVLKISGPEYKILESYKL